MCGNKRSYIRYVPNPVLIFGQSCQLTSFNSPSFESMGKSQTSYVPVCFSCATLTVDTLIFLLRDSQYHTVVTFKEQDSLRSQVAVYWLKASNRIDWKGFRLDQKIFASPIQNLISDETEKRGLSPTELGQLQELIKMPKTGREEAIRIDVVSFCMAVHSVNKGRLVIRDWIHTFVSCLLENLGIYLDAIRIVHPHGEQDKILTRRGWHYTGRKPFDLFC